MSGRHRRPQIIAVEGSSLPARDPSKARIIRYTPNVVTEQRPSSIADAFRRLRDFYNKNRDIIDPVMALTAHLSRGLLSTKPVHATSEPYLSVQNEIASLKEIQSLLVRSPLASRYGLN